MKQVFFWVSLLVAIALDRLSKYLVSGSSDQVVLWKGVFSIGSSKNYLLAGFDLSILLISIIVLLALAFVVFIFIYYKLWQKRWGMVALGLIVAGAGSNLLERIAQGYVWDVFHIEGVNIFNIADLAVVVGCLAMAVLVWNKGTKKKPALDKM